MPKATIHPLVEWARKFSPVARPEFRFILDRSNVVQVQPMTGRVLRYAKEVAVRKECYYNAMKLVLQDGTPDIRYVVGYAWDGYASEHAWVKIGKTHYDPTWQLFLSIDCDYLPLFELDLENLCREMLARDSLYPPDLRDLVRWTHRNQRPREEKAGEGPSGHSHLRLDRPAKGDTL